MDTDLYPIKNCPLGNIPPNYLRNVFIHYNNNENNLLSPSEYCNKGSNTIHTLSLDFFMWHFTIWILKRIEVENFCQQNL